MLFYIVVTICLILESHSLSIVDKSQFSITVDDSCERFFVSISIFICNSTTTTIKKLTDRFQLFILFPYHSFYVDVRKKLSNITPPSKHPLQNDPFTFQGVFNYDMDTIYLIQWGLETPLTSLKSIWKYSFSVTLDTSSYLIIVFQLHLMWQYNHWIKSDANGLFVQPHCLLFPVNICKKNNISPIQKLQKNTLNGTFFNVI